ncbi:O-methyltransferase-domain-containing protein [Cyathus striatus]|nr:O-methyltransferase-domain-containing protein [Cyathus striatus]
MSQKLALARLTELLHTIEEVGQSLRKHLEQQESTESHAGQIAEELSLPFHADSVTANQASLLRVASERLARLVTPPRHLVFEASGSFYTSLGLNIVLKHDIATYIHTENNNVPAEQISKKCSLDADLLAPAQHSIAQARLLRYLSQRGIFQETSPGVFSNTTASSTLIHNPEFKAHLDLIIHEGQLAAPYFEQLMHERFKSGANSGPLSAFTLFSGGDPMYKWIHLPENAHRGKNFNLAMRSMARTEGLDFLPLDYPFSSLPQDKLLVDVGGGIGALPELLLPTVPHLRFIVQDLEATVALASGEAASLDMKRYIANEKVRFMVQDCFSAQPDEVNGAVFILKNMMRRHNYPDSKSHVLLTHIKNANPTKLLIIDRVVSPHLRTEAEDEKGESEIYHNLRRNPTETGVGVPVNSQGVPTMYDLVMGSLHGGRARTLMEWKGLLKRGGFRLNGVFPLRASMGQAVLEALPQV